MRPIDADRLEEDIRKYADNIGCGRGEYELANGVLKALSVVKESPTVCATDKVAELLEEKRLEYQKRIAQRTGACYHDETERVRALSERMYGIEQAIEIVKGGKRKC